MSRVGRELSNALQQIIVFFGKVRSSGVDPQQPFEVRTSE
jgi:hypothetical protein